MFVASRELLGRIAILLFPDARLDPLKRLRLEDKRRRPQGEMWRERKELTCLQWDSLGQEGGVRVCFGVSSLLVCKRVGRPWRNGQGLYWVTCSQPDSQNFTISSLHGLKHSMKVLEKRDWMEHEGTTVDISATREWPAHWGPGLSLHDVDPITKWGLGLKNKRIFGTLVLRGPISSPESCPDQEKQCIPTKGATARQQSTYTQNSTRHGQSHWQNKFVLTHAFCEKGLIFLVRWRIPNS